MAMLEYLFNISILIGFSIPLLNIFTGWFGDFLGGLDVDFDIDASTDVGADIGIDAGTDIDLGVDTGTDIGADAGAHVHPGQSGIIPFNFMCLCLFLIVFGAFGHMTKMFMTNTLMMALLTSGCVVMGGFSYWAMYKFLIKRLKNNNAAALTYHNLRGKNGIVTLSIHGDSMGTISVQDSTGAPISFRAIADPDLKDRMPDIIATGESVIVTDVDTEKKLCHISVPLSKLKK